MDLKENQAALILEASADGEITVDVQSPDSHSFASALCHALAMKLMHDEQLQVKIELPRTLHVVAVAREHRKAQVVADQGIDPPTLPFQRQPAAARGIALVLVGIAEQTAPPVTLQIATTPRSPPPHHQSQLTRSSTEPTR